MPIQFFAIQNFRNIETLHWEPAPGLNVLEGENAQGKTNLLEAVYCLANGRSFRMADTSNLLRFGQGRASLLGRVAHHDLLSEIQVDWTAQQREMRLNGKIPSALARVQDLIRVLAFVPDSATLLRTAPEVRRRYFDYAMASHQAGYAALLKRYGRVLKQRNEFLLRRDSFSGLAEGLDGQWAQAAEELMAARDDFLQSLLPFWRERLKSLMGQDLVLSARWEGRLREAGALELERILEELKKSEPLERRFGRTVLGPHREDLGVYLGSHPVRIVASQGQQRMLVIALKLAEADLFFGKNGQSPVFLLDDLGSELDQPHLIRLLDILGDLKAQTILTTAREGMYRSLKARTFRVKAGTLKELTNVE